MALCQSEKPDLILLDVMLPGKNGILVCHEIKKEPSLAQIPVIILSAKNDESDIVKGLQSGADDYIEKPFSPKILMARIHAVLRRNTHKEMPKIIRYNTLEIHTLNRKVTLDQTEIKLTYSEFEALALLCGNPGRVYTRYQIIEAIHGSDHDVTDRTIDVTLVGLRKKLGDQNHIIESVRGIGYKCQEP